MRKNYSCFFFLNNGFRQTSQTKSAECCSQFSYKIIWLFYVLHNKADFFIRLVEYGSLTRTIVKHVSTFVILRILPKCCEFKWNIQFSKTSGNRHVDQRYGSMCPKLNEGLQISNKKFVCNN